MLNLKFARILFPKPFKEPVNFEMIGNRTKIRIFIFVLLTCKILKIKIYIALYEIYIKIYLFIKRVLILLTNLNNENNFSYFNLK